MTFAGKLGFIIIGFVVLAVSGQKDEELCDSRTDELRLVTVPDSGCKKFAVCQKGKFYGRQQCPLTTRFNEKTQRCDFMKNVNCDSEMTVNPECLHGVNPTNCSRFHWCFFGHQYDFTCLPPTVYSSYDHVCKWPADLHDDEWQKCGGRRN